MTGTVTTGDIRATCAVQLASLYTTAVENGVQYVAPSDHS